MTPTLRTERLVLSPYRPEDEEVFVALLGDEEVCRWMGQDRVPEEEIRGIFQAILHEIYGKNLFDVWAVWSDGVFVGHAEIKKTGNVDGYEMVAALVKESRGRGVGNELIRGLLRYAADTLQLDEVYGMVGAENAASLALGKKLGFTHVRDVVGDDGTVTKMLVLPTGNSRSPGAGPAPGRTAALDGVPSQGNRPSRGADSAPGAGPAAVSVG
ncbi:GNAT family N-acetyltransferase [Streptomyces angustmyceticus]|uniref:GNAT family N-acetyltransferase n=1 Tax=Streptomyces angustmyceticus TaxID=285578 RepID=UPI0028BEE6F6|nr:GNAT family N-acetyltransferase [Streptomyces angustmyceticus]